MGRAEAEELLGSDANSQGTFLLRLSPDRHQLVLSIKSYNEDLDQYGFRHFPVNERESKAGDSTVYSLSDTMEAASLAELVTRCQEPSLGLMQAACLVPNPTSEPSLVRGWELECQPDAWMIPRWAA